MIKKKPEISCANCANRKKGIFAELPVQFLKRLNQDRSVNVYKAGQIIFYEGNKPFGVYCICSGKVKLTKIGRSGRKQIVRMAKDGDLLGYRAILAKEQYFASAEAIEDSKVCFIERGNFMEMVEKNWGFSQALLSKLSKELRAAEERLTSAVQKSVKQRLAEVLDTLYGSFGKAQSGVLDINLSREEMAELADTTQETVIRLLRKFESEGLIKVQRRKITINNHEALQDLAGVSKID